MRSSPVEARVRESTNYWSMSCRHGDSPATDMTVICLPWLRGIDSIPPGSEDATVRFNVRRRVEIEVAGCTIMELVDDDPTVMNKIMRNLELVQPSHRWLQLTNGLPILRCRRWWGRWLPIRRLERDAATRLVR